MIKVENLTKKYGKRIAVNDISFEVKKGSVCGFLGPNGAGKSTTMNMLSGVIMPFEGSISIGGHDMINEPSVAKKLIGYLPEIPPLYPEMTAREYLYFAAELKQIPVDEREDAVLKAISSAGIGEEADRVISALSKGYRQRVGIAYAVLGDPAVIILDEPTVGLDPKQMIEIRELVRELGREHTVLLSTHILSEIKEVCDSVIIIAGGRIIAADSIENIERLGAEHPEITIIAKTDPMTAMDIIDEFEEISHYAITETDKGTKMLLTLAYAADISEKLFFAFSNNQIALLEMQENKRSFEELYLKMTEEALPTEEEENAILKNKISEENDDYISLFNTEGDNE